MEDLLYKKLITEEEATKLDDFLNDNFVDSLKMDNKDIIRIIDNIEDIIGVSMFRLSLDWFLSEEALHADVGDRSKHELYYKYAELISYFEFDDYGFVLSLADEIANSDREFAIKLYEHTFSNHLNYDEGYYYKLVKYFKLLNINPKDLLIEMINNTEEVYKYSLDFINSCLLLIINLGKNDSRYLKYIDMAIPYALKAVENYRKTSRRVVFSDSDIERDLCELIALKFEYFVNKKDYVTAFKLYKELTKEIGKSDCTRYYHARDLFYYRMLSYMKEEYEELKFFDDFKYDNFEVVEKINDINKHVKKTITLKNSKGYLMKFKIINIYENSITLVPILPLLGEGGLVFLCIDLEDDKIILKH